MMKKFVSLLLALSLCLSMIAFADTSSVTGEVNATVTVDGENLTDITFLDQTVDPAQKAIIDAQTDKAFAELFNDTKVELEDGTTSPSLATVIAQLSQEDLSIEAKKELVEVKNNIINTYFANNALEQQSNTVISDILGNQEDIETGAEKEIVVTEMSSAFASGFEQLEGVEKDVEMDLEFDTKFKAGTTVVVAIGIDDGEGNIQYIFYEGTVDNDGHVDVTIPLDVMLQIENAGGCTISAISYMDAIGGQETANN